MELLEYHTEFSINTDSSYDNDFVINGSHALRIKSYSMSLIGPALGGTQYGWIYLWRDTAHYTLMLPCNPFMPRYVEKDFGDNWLAVPADTEEQLCVKTQFPGGMPSGMTVDVNITYLLEP